LYPPEHCDGKKSLIFLAPPPHTGGGHFIWKMHIFIWHVLMHWASADGMQLSLWYNFIKMPTGCTARFTAGREKMRKGNRTVASQKFGCDKWTDERERITAGYIVLEYKCGEHVCFTQFVAALLRFCSTALFFR